VRLLQELNPDVQGNWFPMNKVSFISFPKRLVQSLKIVLEEAVML
jgi:hypothetical protein